MFLWYDTELTLATKEWVSRNGSQGVPCDQVHLRGVGASEPCSPRRGRDRAYWTCLSSVVRSSQSLP